MTLTFDLIIHWWARYHDGLSCAKFGDFSFSHFSCVVRTDRQNHRMADAVEPILKLPDLSREFTLQTDASNQSLGGCLLQEHEGVKHPVFYASKKLISREQNYSVGEREREALAIIWAIRKFHRYLYGQHFTLESDLRPLEYLQTSHPQNPKIMRWSLALQPYHFTVKYIRGSENVVADYLSRSN